MLSLEEAVLELRSALNFIVNDIPIPGEDAVLSSAGYNKACDALSNTKDVVSPEKAFILKWIGEEESIWWSETPARLFWARSYQMPRQQLREMSRDFLAIPHNGSSNSSLDLAQRVVNSE